MTRIAILVLKIAGTTLAFWLVLRNLPAGTLARFTVTVAPGWLVVIALLHGAIVTMMVVRLRMLMAWWRNGNGLDTPIPRFTALRATLLGLTGLQLGLGLVGGEALRSMALRPVVPSWRDAIILSLLDRVIGLAGLVALVGVIAVAGPGHRWIGWAALAVLALGAGGIALVARLVRPLPLTETARRVIALAATPLGAVVLGLTVAAHGLNVAIFFCVAAALGVALPGFATLIAVPLGILMSVLPVSLGGWGVRELAIASTIELFGYPSATILAISIAFGVTHVASGLPGLILLLLQSRGAGHGDDGNGGSGRSFQ